MPERRMVTRRCLKWARVATKYKQVQSGDPDAPVVKRVPVEWGFRCLEWAPYLAQPPRKPGTRSVFSPYNPPPEGPRRYGKSKKLYRADPFEGIVCRIGGKLTRARRNRLPSSAFGLPRERKYPMPDVSHARNAKARASMMLRRGGLSRVKYNKIVRKANAIINRCRRAR
jgi:hypothetical protein